MKVLWTETAIKQRNYVFNYWDERNHSNSYSEKLKLKIIQRLKLLKKFPRIGRSLGVSDFRLSVLGHYSLIYRLVDEKLIIAAFWDNRQDPTKLLEYLKK